MQNWNLLFRRTHLYLGLLLVPWLLIYALSTVAYNHPETFRPYRQEAQLWERIWEKDYPLDYSLRTPNTEQQALATKLLADQGIKAIFFANRQGQQFFVNLPSFRQPQRFAYDIERKKLRLERRRFSFVELLSRLHTRSGYGRGGALDNLWAVAVDLWCVATLVWIATGLYLWWKLPQTRRWGFLAIIGGVTTIAVLLLTV